ncbi:acetyl-CoA carboxylase carboxyltransferase subunit beta [[Clostridium] spiroforme]|nr:acetyl-CoA carboxylase carboxyltransferase subunit beta [Thomasclavelia spiroformis]
MIQDLFQERKERIRSFNRLIRKNKNVKKKEAPDGLYTNCKECGEMSLTQAVIDNHYVCPKCGHHFRIGAYTRLKMVYDHERFRELFKGMKINDPLDFPGYKDKLLDLQKKTHLEEAVVVADGKINHVKTVVCVMDTRFLMGSMGSVVGEKITRGIEYATRHKRPLIIFTCSGGARMQEGIISLMQMAKTSAALARHHEAGLLYISYITHPTTGGVTASFATLGDIIIAEPKALIGFAGRRVIESTIKETLPDDFQTAEFMEAQGFVDLIVERKDMKNVISRILRMHGLGE